MNVSKAISLAKEALQIDGANHKQWYLEEILKSLDVDLKEYKNRLNKEDYDWEEGIAP
jgi:hypothetical protein